MWVKVQRNKVSFDEKVNDKMILEGQFGNIHQKLEK